MIQKYPNSFARFYDTIYHQMRDSTDHDYFQGQIRKTSGKILEVGAGTGRMFSVALDNGADIYGLDISESMLEVLYKKIPATQHFRISQQNITDFTFDFRFDLIIAPFRVIMHLIDKEDQIRALNNVYNHLNKNGIFIFDTFVPDLNQLINGLKNQKDFEGEYKPGFKIRRYVSTTPSLINQTITVNFHLEWEEKEGLKHDDWILPMRFFFRYELEHLVERSGFESNYDITGDYRGNKLSNDSKEFIVTCRKIR